MYIEIVTRVELTHQEGKFASREELVEALIEEIADPGEIEASEGGRYAVDGWESEEDTPSPPSSDRKIIDKLGPAIFVLTGTQDRKKAQQFLELARASGVRIL
jgi:hypothetical protein